METGFADHQGVAAGAAGRPEQFAAAPQATATIRTGCSGSPTICSRSMMQEVHQPSGQIPQRQAPRASRSGPPLALCVRHQGSNAAQPQSRRQVLVDPLGSRIQRGVRAEDRNPGGNKIQEQSADRRIGRHASDGGKRQRMVRQRSGRPAPRSPRPRWPGVIVRQVIIRRTSRRRSPTRSPTLSHASASRGGASFSRTAQSPSRSSSSGCLAGRTRENTVGPWIVEELEENASRRQRPLQPLNYTIPIILL